MTFSCVLYVLLQGGRRESYVVIPTFVPDPGDTVRAFDPIVPFFENDVSSLRGDILRETQALWNGIRDTGHTKDPAFVEAVVRIGSKIRGLIPQAFRALAVRADVSNLILVTNDAEIPWLWARDENGSLGLRYNFGMLLCEEGRVPATPAPPAGAAHAETELARRLRSPKAAEAAPYSMLILADSKVKKPNRRRQDMQALASVDHEVDAIHERFGANMEIIVIRPEDEESAVADFLTKLKDHESRLHILHYAGHIAEDGSLIVGNGRKIISPKMLHDYGFSLAKRPLVFLNGCGSGKVARNWRHTGSLATTFLNVGAYGCVVSLMPIEDRLAAEFAVRFYEELVESKASVGAALRRTRKGILGDEERTNDASAFFFNFFGDPRVSLKQRSTRATDIFSLPDPGSDSKDWDEQISIFRRRYSVARRGS